MKTFRGRVGRRDIFRPAHSFFHSLVDFIYPPFCLLCERRLAAVNILLCPQCEQKLQPAENAWETLEKLDVHVSGTVYFTHSFAPFVFFEEIQELIHEMKYKNMNRLGHFFGEKMAQHMPPEALENIDVLVPVPLYSARYRERGYNQSEEICRGMAAVTELPVLSALSRTRYTQQQAKFSREQRMANVRGAFRVKHPQNIKEKSVAVVDDVMTTGSTMNECAKCLIDAGARQIVVCSIARI